VEARRRTNSLLWRGYELERARDSITPVPKRAMLLLAKSALMPSTTTATPRPRNLSRVPIRFLSQARVLNLEWLVTQENQAKEQRIPEVCRAFGVKYMNIYGMNRELEMKLPT
jgi:hypothetical protein